MQGYIYIESYKESHVKDAVRGLRNIYTSKAPKLVPIKEMVDAITVNRKAKAMIGMVSIIALAGKGLICQRLIGVLCPGDHLAGMHKVANA